ncbi:Mnd1 family-domain-containing protein [Ampelomyces quisqualis]|uniref:RING-type E3 ubiquitin transferase n=1 Tax=Ampelomyces quisqualis TaxID=50730 RepID=A0A6A5QHY8_AMPQU|nr:Mnd1 family-domain-containing protein [Ampelomyces quisqualis]
MDKAWKCMDETALIALGILMEEIIREVLGETGDLTFTEAADEEEERALASEDDDAEQDEQDEESTEDEARERPATAPKIQANPQKAATILAWFHKTAQAHSIKDLEKTLPQVGAISGMHVKDYLQALADDNKIRVEKIGSGNWYWSFLSDEKKAKDSALEKAQDEFNKINAAVAELQAKVDEAGAARAEDEDILMETGGDRKTLITKHTDLTKELEKLRIELAAYSEQDPVEMEKKAAETLLARQDAEKFTDHIFSMEGWIKSQCAGDPAGLGLVLRMLYDDEFDEDEGGLQQPRIFASHQRRARGGRGRGRGGPAGAEDRQEHYGNRGRGRGDSQHGRGRGHREGTASRGGHALEKGKALLGGSEEQAQPLPTIPKVVLPQGDDEDDVEHTAVAPCNHRSCHICSIRMRALYKTKACAHCRTESDHVILTGDAEKNYEDFTAADFFQSNNSLGIHFENPQVFEDTRLLLQYNCPEEDCDVACLGWPDLHRHVKTAHGKVMCDLCTRNKKVFTHEHELFTFPELRKHQKFGDDNPGAIDQSGFKGHPECGFCRERFYGDDELYTHCRDKHERCHICDRRDGSRKQQYYVNYDSLENHFHKEHFLCPDRECLEKKFVVFDSEMDLKAHQIETHPNGLSKDALRDARRVDMSGFQFRAPHEQEAGGRQHDRRREGGRGRGRGRDPNAEPLPASSAQTLSRAELAYQRQMEAQNSQSVTARTFGGQLTSTPTPGEAFAARAPPSVAAQPTVTVARPPAASNLANGLSQMSLNAQPPSSTPQTPQDQARLLRHNAVVERATALLRNDKLKLLEFRTSISSYRNSESSATQLIEGFFALFDTNSKEMGKLIKELADIFEIPAKREGLLKAWNDWKAINEDYPSLPGSATGSALNGGAPAHGGSRVLKLKSSTAQSSRSSANQKASWSSPSASNPFPALPPTSSNRIGAKPGQTPWASSSGPSSARPSPQPSRNVSSSALNKKPNTAADAFPALPAAPKPSSTIFSPGYTGLGLRRDNSGRNTPVNNPWAGPATANSGPTTPAAEDEGAGKKKGNKGKKQMLFHFG